MLVSSGDGSRERADLSTAIPTPPLLPVKVLGQASQLACPENGGAERRQPNRDSTSALRPRALGTILSNENPASAIHVSISATE